jgi:hypothetical protein
MYSLYTVNGIIASNCRCNSHVVIPTVTRPIETPIIDTSHLVKADFVEGEHPRDKGGEFTSKGGEGAGGKMEKPVKVVRSEKKEGEGKDSEGRHTFHGSRFSKTVTEAQRSGIVDAVTKYATVPTHHLEGIEFSVNPKEVYGDDVFLIDSDYSFQDTDGKRFPALYNPETHQVLIIPKFTENIPGYAEEIVHEIGHHVHMTLYPNKYTDDAISEIMKVAKTDYISYDLPGYAFTSPREFMAEVYRKICINKNPTTLNNLAKLFNVNKVEDIWR